MTLGSAGGGDWMEEGTAAVAATTGGDWTEDMDVVRTWDWGASGEVGRAGRARGTWRNVDTFFPGLAGSFSFSFSFDVDGLACAVGGGGDDVDDDGTETDGLADPFICETSLGTPLGEMAMAGSDSGSGWRSS
jgi:hypothetical protein